jgi:hypothetical protein
MDTRLPAAAHALLRHRLVGEWVEVNAETMPTYQELVEAGMMESLHSFARGSSGAYRLTEIGREFTPKRMAAIENVITTHSGNRG